MAVPPQLLLGLGFSAEQLDCAGVKLTLCEVYCFGGGGEVLPESKKIPQYLELKPRDDGVFTLEKGAYLIRYCEYVKVP
ncbi:MAG: hypothetical protein QXE75_01250, partial [Sulfolobales archaeon]